MIDYEAFDLECRLLLLLLIYLLLVSWIFIKNLIWMVLVPLFSGRGFWF